MAKVHPLPPPMAAAPAPRLHSVLKAPHELSMFSITKVAKKVEQGVAFKVRKTFFSPATQSASLYIFQEEGWTRKTCIRIVEHPWFERCVLLMIVGSCLTLAMYDPKQPADSDYNTALNIADMVFSILFAIEMILRTISQCFIFAPDAYLASGWRRLDFLIVTVSFISFIPGANKAGTVRVVRVLRPLKAISNLSGARMMVTTLIESLPLMMDVGILILWLVLVFSIIGMQQWLGKMSSRCFDASHNLNPDLVDTPCVAPEHQGGHCPVDQMCLDTGQDPDGGYTSFNNLAYAALAVFQVLTMVNWTNLLYQLQASGPGWVAIVWCFLLIAIGALFSLNLLVAVIGSKFSQENMLEKRRNYKSGSPQDALGRSTSFQFLRRKLGKRMYRITRKLTAPLWWDIPFSAHLRRIVASPRFDNAVMAVICLQTLLLSLDYYGMSETERLVIQDISYVTSGIFILEMVLKIWGLTVGGYFGSGQNVFDAIIVMLTVIELFLSSSKLKALQAFRLLRILRTVRIFRAYKNFRRLMDSILHGLVSLREFLLLLGICIFIFAVLGMQLFGGNVAFSGERQNFDTMWMSVLIMFQGLTATTYTQTMWHAMHAVGWPAAAYFVAWMVVGNIGLLNLLLAIMIDHFNSDPTESDGERSMKRMTDAGDGGGIFGMIAKRRQRIFAHEAERTAAWLRAVGEEYVPKKKLSFIGRFSSTVTKLRGVSSFMRKKKSVTSSNNSSITSSAAPSVHTSVSSRTQRSVTGRTQVARSRQSVTGRNFLYAAANAAEAKVEAKKKEREEAEQEVSPWKAVAAKMGVEKVNKAKPKSMVAILAAMQPSKTGGDSPTRAWSVGKDLSVSRRSASVVGRTMLSGATLSPASPGAKQRRASSMLRLQVDAPPGPASGPASPPDLSSPKSRFHARRAHSVADMSALRDRLVAQAAADRPNDTSHPTVSSHRAIDNDGESPWIGKPLSLGNSPEPEAEGASEREPLLPHLTEFKMRKAGAEDGLQGLVTEPAQAAAPSAMRGGMWRTRSMRKRETRGSAEEDIDEEEWRNLPGACMPSKRQLAPLLSWEVLPPPVPGDLVLPYDLPDEVEDELVVSKAELRRRAGIPKSCGTLISTALPNVGRQRLAGKPAASMTTQGTRAPTRTKKKGDLKVAAKAIGRALQGLLANPMESAGCMRYRSLGFLPPTSPFRRALFLLVSSKEYEWLSLIMVIASCLSLALDSPELSDTSPLKHALWFSDIIFATFFSAECLVKILIMGLYAHEGAFLHSSWNKLDVLVTVCSIAACFVSPTHQGDQVKSLRSFRLLRALRPLRMVSKLKNLRMVILTLSRALPSCINVIALGLFFFIIYGVLGVQLFAGTFYRCNDNSVRSVEECVGTFTDPSTGLLADRVWSNAHINFDNLWYAIVAIFVVVTLDDWPSLMFQAMDATGVGKQPRLNNQIWASIYFIFLLLMGAVFWANLLAGVVTDCYSKLPPEDKDMLFITESQKRWAQAIKMKRYENQVSMHKSAPPQANVVRRVAWAIVTSKTFDYAVLTLIMLNILLLAVQHKDEDYVWLEITRIGNYIFTYSFCAELLLKLTALGPRKYWADGWNRFDLVVVAGSVLDLNVKTLNIGARVFRLGRLFKIIKASRGLRTLVNAFVGALPAMFNVGLLFFIMIFIAAILGMDLFGTLPDGEGIFDHNNYRNVGNSLLACLKLFTGDNWTPIYFQTTCSGNGAECLVHILVPVYVLLYTVIMRFMLLNLVLSVILDRFTDSATYEGLLSTDNFFDALQRKMLLDGFVRKLKMKIRGSPNGRTLARSASARSLLEGPSQNPVPAGLVAFALSKAKQREQQRATSGREVNRGSDEDSMPSR
ncbi:T-type voltage-gated Ca2+ channel [Klebsormidium nitens]|uniref:T-type voltage-gated Ca2+ channel n=1 Tax=Klebsormidium nitens TaxID=105231 RepID=A0A1Y1IED7_KLENI|nr:T-type voltage-gated Ca2+ channel [Klebsormidium nitens]|eukprot:GAQ86458.1 T-type voltage-gated Ca2+ channel [Klebsormidium nitens]